MASDVEKVEKLALDLSEEDRAGHSWLRACWIHCRAFFRNKTTASQRLCAVMPSSTLIPSELFP